MVGKTRTRSNANSRRRSGTDDVFERAWKRPRGGLSGPYLRNLPAVDILDVDGEEAIHDASMRILEEIGIRFRGDAESLSLWREAGADVTGEDVRIPRQLALQLLEMAPSQFVQHARDPGKSVQIGGDKMVFAPVFSCPTVHDLDGNRRQACLEDFHDFVRLTQMASSLNHCAAQICEPMDVPAPKRHLDVTHGLLRYADKPFMGDARGKVRAEDTLAMARLVFGEDFVANNTVLVSLINAASPRLWDATMLEAAKVYARNGQALIIAPFIMQGANSPVTLAGALAQLNAEAVAGMAFAQLLRPGTPVIYGSSLSTVSMKSGAPTYGTSEIAKLNMAIAQLARRYGVPLRGGGFRNGAMASDAIAGYQNMITMLSGILGGGHFMLHSAGWLESSMAISFAQFVIDLDQLAVLQRFAEGIEITEETLARDAIAETEPAGHFFAHPHTLRHYNSIFLEPMIESASNYEAWVAGGAKDITSQARNWARRALDAYERPFLDAAVDEALADYVARRKRELPDIEV